MSSAIALPGATSLRSIPSFRSHAQPVRGRATKRSDATIPEVKAPERLQRKADSDSLTAAVRRAQRGDAAAFETIYQLHSRRVYALCLRMLGDPVEAEDLAQEAFLQLFRKIQTFRGESAFSSWLHRLTANVVLMSFRRRSRRRPRWTKW